MIPVPDTTHSWLIDILGSDIPLGRVTQGSGGEVYVRISTPDFARAAARIASSQFALIGLFGLEAFENTPGTSILYVFEKQASLLVLIPEGSGTLPSIARIFPSASWFERECRDGFGFEFADAFDTRRLFLHEPYPENFHPLKKSCVNAPITPVH